MNLLIDWLPAAGWPRFVADAIWQSTLAGVVGIACVFLIARRPTTKACVSLWTMVAALALPFLSAGARQFGWGVFAAGVVVKSAEIQEARQVSTSLHQQTPIHQSAESSVNVDWIISGTVEESPSLALQNETQDQPLAQSPAPSSASTFAMTIWLVLSGTLFLRLLMSVWQARRWMRDADPSDDETVNAAVRAAANRLGIVAPRVSISDKVRLPTVFAFGRGVLLLPRESVSIDSNAENADAGRSITYERWFAVFCHELGHVRRHDGRNRLTVEMVLAFLPWQPLVWLLRREFLRHAEEACDDWAIASGVNPLDYATVLAEFIPSVPRCSLGATIMTTDAKSRILRLLALRETPRPHTAWPQLTGIAAAVCIVVAGAAMAQRSDADQDSQTDKNKASVPAATDATKREVAGREAADYALEPADVVTIDVLRLNPKALYRIRAVDVLRVDLKGGSPFHKVDNQLLVVEPGGFLNLGAAYGKFKVAGLSLDEARDAVEAELRRTVKRPQVSLSLHESSGQIAGEHTVAVDGYLNLGTFGQVQVGGMTIGEARKAIEKKLSEHFEKPSISLALQSRSQFQGIRPHGRAAAESKSVYVLEPPDIILVQPIRLLPKGPQRVERLDQLEIAVSGTLEEAPIKGPYPVDADGEISLGPEYGRLNVAGLTVKETIQKIDEHLSKTLVQPEVAVRITDKPKNKQVGGDHLIGPDGHINLGTFGQVYVAGMTVDEARMAIEKKLAAYFDKPSVAVDVTAYNSKVYYVIVQGGDAGDSIFRFPLTGNDTVLDALAQVNAKLHKNTRMWISRRAGENETKTLRIDWEKITAEGDAVSNHQLRPGDRVFLQDSEPKGKAAVDPTKSDSAFGPPRSLNSDRGITGRIDRDSGGAKFGF